MCHGDDGAGVCLQVMLEPCDGLGIEMVRRLVEQEDIGFPEEKAAQRHASLLAARDKLHPGVGGRAPERVHRHVEPRVEVPRVQMVYLLLDLSLLLEQVVHLFVVHRLGELRADLVVFAQKLRRLVNAFLYDLPDRLLLVEDGLLLEESDRVAGGRERFSDKIPVDSCEYPQQRALAGAVEAEDTDLGAVEVRQRDVLEDLLVVVVLAHPHHRVDDLVRLVCHSASLTS